MATSQTKERVEVNVQKLATAGSLLALSVGAVTAPANAAARSKGKHRNSHHLAGPGRGAHHAGLPGNKAHTVSFTARVVRSSASGLLVRTADGRILHFSKKQIKPTLVPKRRKSRQGHGRRPMHASDLQVSSGNVVVNILGLQPGVLLQIAETIDSNGNVTITITLPPLSGQEQASGVVTEVGSDTFEVQSSDGVALRLHMSADALSKLNLESCEMVDVTYHQDTGILVADNVTGTGSSATGDCAPTYDATGIIAQVSAGGLTINGDNGPVSFSVDPSSDLTSGFQAGDLVNVTYTKNSDGSLTATDVQFVEGTASGQVTSISSSANGGSLTITDDDNRQSETFSADPTNGVQINAHAFNGVSVGDQVALTYHQSSGHLVADTVTEQ